MLYHALGRLAEPRHIQGFALVSGDAKPQFAAAAAMNLNHPAGLGTVLGPGAAAVPEPARLAFSAWGVVGLAEAHRLSRSAGSAVRRRH